MFLISEPVRGLSGPVQGLFRSWPPHMLVVASILLLPFLCHEILELPTPQPKHLTLAGKGIAVDWRVDTILSGCPSLLGTKRCEAKLAPGSSLRLANTYTVHPLNVRVNNIYKGDYDRNSNFPPVALYDTKTIFFFQAPHLTRHVEVVFTGYSNGFFLNIYEWIHDTSAMR